MTRKILNAAVVILALVFVGAAGVCIFAPDVAAQAVHRASLNRSVAYGASPTAVAAAAYGEHISDLQGRPYVNTSHPRAVNCVLTTTATTSTQITGCEVVAGHSYYITSIQVYGDIANAVSTPFIVQSGTSTACTGPNILAAGYHVALSGSTMTFPVPIKATVAEGLCILDGTTGTKKVSVQGYLAP